MSIGAFFKNVASDVENIASNVQRDVTSAFGGINDTFDAVSDFAGGSGIGDFIGGAQGFLSKIRSKNISRGANPFSAIDTSSAQFAKSSGFDWRVKLSLPNDMLYESSPLLAPLVTTGGFTFPYTPSVVFQHSADYNAMQPVHTNYPFFSYEGSKVDSIMLTGNFHVQNALEARYWVACLHYLRSVTKMYYGQGSENQGNPPPVVRLNGYGDYVFKSVPVIIQTFSLDMGAEVDYIATGLGSPNINGGVETGGGVAYAPVESQFAVTCVPIYSRSQQEAFNMNDFVNGDLILNGRGYI
jgi:hypothetical protein